MNLFEEYVKNFDMTIPLIKSRYNHTFRVQRLCEQIAKSLNLSENDINLASLCGLYHDIGRFKQIDLFNSYSDLKTGFDHGNEGEKIFIKEISQKMTLKNDEIGIIQNAIKYHNKLDNNNLKGKEKLFCDIVRDADTIDILNEIIINIIKVNTNGDISKECHDAFMNQKLINIKDVKTPKDDLLVKLAFIWNMQFPMSLKIIKEQKYYEKLEKIINNNDFKIYFDMIYQRLENV